MSRGERGEAEKIGPTRRRRETESSSSPGMGLRWPPMLPKKRLFRGNTKIMIKALFSKSFKALSHPCAVCQRGEDKKRLRTKPILTAHSYKVCGSSHFEGRKIRILPSGQTGKGAVEIGSVGVVAGSDDTPLKKFQGKARRRRPIHGYDGGSSLKPFSFFEVPSPHFKSRGGAGGIFLAGAAA